MYASDASWNRDLVVNYQHFELLSPSPSRSTLSSTFVHSFSTTTTRTTTLHSTTAN